MTVVEETTDARGITGERVLGSTTLTRGPPPAQAAGATRPALTVPITSPTRPTVRCASTTAITPRSKWLRSPPTSHAGGSISLCTGRPPHALDGQSERAPPRYDLALIAQRVLASPAEAASLGEMLKEESPAAPTTTPRWFWAFVLVAVGALLFAFMRTLRAEPGP